MTTIIFILNIILTILAHQTILSANTVLCTNDMQHSTSDQTGIRQPRITTNNVLSHTQTGSNQLDKNQTFPATGDPNWPKFWPKHSPRSETFFRYNAKPSVAEEKATIQNIPEDIPDFVNTMKGNKSIDPFTSYMEMEKEKNKMRPKVWIINEFILYIQLHSISKD